MTTRTVVDRAYSAAELARAIIKPSSIVGVRLPTYPEVIATATTQLTSDAVVKGDATTGVYGLLTRSPVMPLWLSQASADKWQYQATYSVGMKFVEPLGTIQDTAASVPSDFANTYSGNVSAGVTSVGVSGAAQPPYYAGNAVRPHAPLAINPQISTDIPFVFVPKNAVVTQLIWLAGSAVAVELLPGSNADMEFLVRGSETDEFSSGSWTISNNTAFRSYISSNNYWVKPGVVSVTVDNASVGGSVSVYTAICVANVITAPLITANAGAAPTLNYTTPAVNTLPCLLPVPGTVGYGAWNFSRKAFQNVIFTGVDFSMENTTKIMNKEGSIHAGALTDADRSAWYAVETLDGTLSAISALPAQRRFRCAAEHGMRATVLPGKNFARSKSHLMSLFGYDTLYTPVMSIMPGDYYTIFAVDDPDLTTANGFLLRCTTAWEYVADTQFVQTKAPGSGIETLHKAMLIVNTTPPFSTFERGTVLAVTGKATARGPQQMKKKPAGSTPKPKPKPKPKAAKPRAPKVGPLRRNGKF